MRLPFWMNHTQDGPPVVKFAFYQRFDLADTPPRAACGRWRRIAERAEDRVPEQPGNLICRGMPGGQRTRRQGATDPVRLLGPLGDLAVGHRGVLAPSQLLTRLV